MHYVKKEVSKVNISTIDAPFFQMSTLFVTRQDGHEETVQHTLRCTETIGKFGSYLGFGEDKVELLQQGAMIHDAGKFSLSPDVLYAQRSLSEDEFTMVKRHPLLGDIDILDSDIKDMKEQHHEHLDGSGYPYGLKGNAISIYAQILAIVDVYDALSHARSYKKAWSDAEVRTEMTNHRWTRFNGDLLDEFYCFIDAQKKNCA